MVQTRERKKPSQRKISQEENLGVLKRGAASPTTRKVSKPTTKATTKTTTPSKTTTRSTPSRATLLRSTPKKPANGDQISLGKITEQEILSANSSGELVNLINHLTSTGQDEIFNNFKLKADAKFEEDEATITNLQQELNEKNQLIVDLQQRLLKTGEVDSKKDVFNSTETSLLPASKPDYYLSPIRQRRNTTEDLINADEISKELDTIGVILDMIQLLTGVKVVNYDQDNHQFFFDVMQTSTNNRSAKINIGYRLVIIKKMSSVSEVNYIPTFIDGDSNDKEVLLKSLPDYFCDNLSFPYQTLSQFYSKMNKALNKIEA